MWDIRCGGPLTNQFPFSLIPPSCFSLHSTPKWSASPTLLYSITGCYPHIYRPQTRSAHNEPLDSLRPAKILDVPNELMCFIFSDVDEEDIINLGSLCRRLNDVAFGFYFTRLAPKPEKGAGPPSVNHHRFSSRRTLVLPYL